MRDVVALAWELVAIDSVSGREGPVMEHVADLLVRGGWAVERQEVTPGRDNVWATRRGGGVTLSTHLDTVPPFIGPSLDDERLWGRGACDAKGIAAAMICAAERLAEKGEERIDLLFVVGEEAGSDGAVAANELPATSRALINGEPTEGRLASGAKGSLRVRVDTAGVAAHSAYPGRGRSAIDAMVRLLSDLHAVPLPEDPELGSTTVNVGMLEGGSAANVVPAACSAELLVRLVGDDRPVRSALDAWAAGRATLTYGAHVPAVRYFVPEGFEAMPVAFTTDAPLLSAWGRAVLYGPGSIHRAHRPDESIELDALRAGVDGYERLARALLASPPEPVSAETTGSPA